MKGGGGHRPRCQKQNLLEETVAGCYNTELWQKMTVGMWKGEGRRLAVGSSKLFWKCNYEEMMRSSDVCKHCGSCETHGCSERSKSPHTEDSESITEGPAHSCIIILQFTKGGLSKRRGEIIHHGQHCTYTVCLFLFNSFNYYCREINNSSRVLQVWGQTRSM